VAEEWVPAFAGKAGRKFADCIFKREFKCAQDEGVDAMSNYLKMTTIWNI
jgi:hypothetical protein